MKAKKADASVQEMVIIIDKSLNTPMQIKVRKGVTWMTIDINSYRANQNTPTSAFVFDAKAHPDYEIIDLR
jgi:outer membrane lipoprotein-sorting protein